MSPEAASAVVVTFHGLASKGCLADASCDIADARYTVPVAIYEETLGQWPPSRSCTAFDFCNKANGSWFVVTLDDGLESDYEIAFPALVRRGLRGTFFVTAENIGKPGFTSASQLTEMSAAGMEIASHGLTHRYLTTMSRDEIVREIRESRERIEQVIGSPVGSFAPVGGHFTKDMVPIAWSAGYRVFATMIPGRTRCSGREVLLRRNHILSHHTASHAAQIARGHSRTFLASRLRYALLKGTKQLLGMDRYDRLKRSILTAHYD